MNTDPNKLRTVLPPRPGSRKTGHEVYDRAAQPVLQMAAQLETVSRIETSELVQRATEALDRFDAELERAGVLPSTVQPARYALGLILDQKARSNRAINISLWAAGAHRMLFDGRDIAPVNLRDFIRKATDAGPDFDGVRVFLERRLADLEGKRIEFRRNAGSNWTGITFVLVAGFILLVAGWAGFVEWRFHRDLTRLFDAEVLDTGLDRDAIFADLPHRLARLSAAVQGVESASTKAPIAIFAGLLGFDAAAHADAVYDEAIQRHLPGALARSIDAVLASEGKSLPLYDTLRAWSVLSGQATWSEAYLAGWLTDRSVLLPDLQGLAPHIIRLHPPDGPLPQPDAELLDQAREFAAQAPEAERAYLEMLRSNGAAALSPWLSEPGVPGLAEVVQRRSGLGMSVPIPGLFTSAGWDYARDVGAGVAVQTARAEAQRLFTELPATQNDTPDRVLDILQRETLARWKGFLADLQVRPFSDPALAVLVSGQLSVPGSPLELLMTEVWSQVGGLDRTRPHAMQLRIASEFAAIIQYAEEGRMAEIADLFAALNVALGAMDKDEPRGLQRLMSVQGKAATVTALRNAPVMVVVIVEDVLAQSTASQADPLGNPLTKAWQAEVLALCKKTTEARFPFAEGPDASLSDAAALLGPDGAMARFFRTRVEPYLDTSADPWRWKPDARFAGLDPKSAEFLQRARAITAGYFGPDGQVGAEMTLSALAERGKAFFALGGGGGPVETNLDPLTLRWPGSDPAAGVEIGFTSAEGADAISQSGEWGLFRALGSLRLRERDGGKRFLVDLRSGGARLFVEIGFQSEANPLSRWKLLKGLKCPTAL